MKVTAVVSGVTEHTRLNPDDAREKYKDVVTLTITDENGQSAATQPISTVAGTAELHVPASAEWEGLQQGQPVTIEVLPLAPAAAPVVVSAATSEPAGEDEPLAAEFAEEPTLAEGDGA